MAKKKTKEQTKINDIVSKIEASESFLASPMVSWTRYYKLYRCFIDDNKWPTKTKIFNPYVFSAIETHTSKSVATKPDGEFIPTQNASGDPQKVGLSFDHWWRLDRGTFKAQSMFKKGLMYGSAMARVFWKFRTGNLNGKKQILDDRPSFRINRLEDGLCGFDPEADSWENSRYAWEKYYISKQELLDWQKGPEAETFDKNKLKEAIETFEKNAYDKDVIKSEKLRVSGSQNVKDDTIKKVECIYLEDYETGNVITLIGRKYIIRETPNPNPFERSFVFLVDTIVPSEVLGMGEVEPVERLQHGLNLIQNQRRDNVEAILKHQWLVGDKGDIDDDELVDELNGIIHASDINQVKALFKPNVTGSAFEEEVSIKQDIQSALAITDASKGNSANLDTAKSGRALALLQSAADARVQAKLQLFEIMFIKEIAEKFQALASIYQKEPLKVMDAGEEIEISPEELKGIFNYYVESGSTTHTDKTQAKEEFLTYMDKLIALADKKIAQLNPPVNPVTASAQPPMPGQLPMPGQMLQPTQVINYDKMAEKLSEKYGVKDWREIWVVNEEQKQETQEIKEMLPSIEESERARDYGEGEMLPPVDLPDMPKAEIPNSGGSGEMLPSID